MTFVIITSRTRRVFSAACSSSCCPAQIGGIARRRSRSVTTPTSRPSSSTGRCRIPLRARDGQHFRERGVRRRRKHLGCHPAAYEQGAAREKGAMDVLREERPRQGSVPRPPGGSRLERCAPRIVAGQMLSGRGRDNPVMMDAVYHVLPTSTHDSGEHHELHSRRRHGHAVYLETSSWASTKFTLMNR